MTAGRCAVSRLLVAVLLAGTARAASAQVQLPPTTPLYQGIAQQAQEGYGDAARVAIAGILATLPESDPSYPEALYTAGTVAQTGDSMRRVFQRIAVDFPASPWSDKALVRLAQLDYGFGSMDRVVMDITRLFNDHPKSPVLAAGALWGARAAFTQQKMQIGCDWLTKGIAAAAGDLELRNQLQFAKQSCNLGPGVQYAPAVPESLRAAPPHAAGDSSAPAVSDTTTHPPAPARPPPPGSKAPTTKPSAAAVASPWRVQVAAISDKIVIARVVKKIEAAGFKAYTVPGPNGLTKIQAGPFATRAAAVAGLPKVKAAVGGSPIVVPGS